MTKLYNKFFMRGASSIEHAEYLKNYRLRLLSIFILQAFILLMIFGLWEWAAENKYIDSFITSQPSAVWNQIVKMIKTGTLWLHIGITVGETVFSFILGTILGILMAIMIWWSKYLAKLLDPFIIVFNSMPKIALGPIFIVWLGNGLPAIIIMALAISVITTFIVMFSGFVEVNPNHIKLVRTFGATKWQVFTKVVFPESVPAIIAALKVNIGLTLVGVIVGEFLVSQAGLGYLIIYGSQVFNFDQVMTSVIILCIVATILYYSVAFIENLYLKTRGGNNK
ncbi:NitT/TauT family transport system permease protein [Desulfonispora thiosulfatigenes DSM 11270]|uniref:NitT/TauT family transport system permease protein n=1 Tax=Desulfonispora thiosulfatigenes DSM 11270 TaxID=656914 RepID=A0A1W1VFE5_DESTI|nr:ABC transporter permease [Desulfonispora thiosulfatigenes]SMB92107.1 NitT/TauT family transport system permease protein [Desulfonispora thiosulfatigenes DSM 11270]